VFSFSGTMGNLISIATHCQRGEEVILGSESHIYHYEQGGVSGEWQLTACKLPVTPVTRSISFYYVPSVVS
jgi:threonine aldolase